jgi:hypothetical protein
MKRADDAEKRANEADKRANDIEESVLHLTKWVTGSPPLEKNVWWCAGRMQAVIRDLRDLAKQASQWEKLAESRGKLAESRGIELAEAARSHALLSLEPEAFWRSLTPAQTAKFMTAAPRVAGPWTREPGSPFTSRRSTAVGHTGDAAYTHNLGDGGWSYSTPDHREVVTVPYPEDGTRDAERSADEALFKAGWVLVDSE